MTDQLPYQTAQHYPQLDQMIHNATEVRLENGQIVAQGAIPAESTPAALANAVWRRITNKPYSEAALGSKNGINPRYTGDEATLFGSGTASPSFLDSIKALGIAIQQRDATK